MSLFSLQFIIFWLVTASAYYLVPKKHKVQNAVLLAANTVFYLFFNIPLFFFLLAEIAFSFFAARKISSSEDIRVKRRWMIGVVAVELFALLFFKYSCFRKTGVSYIFHKPHKYAIIESKKVLKKQHPKGEEKCGKSK